MMVVDINKNNFDYLRNYLVSHCPELPANVMNRIKNDDNLDYCTLNALVLNNIPIETKEYKMFRSISESLYLNTRYKKEYCLCVKRDNPYPVIADPVTMPSTIYDFLLNEESCFKLREEVEWNPYYVQISVAALLFFDNSDTGERNYVTLKCVSGDFKDKYTMVQGHCSFENATLLSGVLKTISDRGVEKGYYKDIYDHYFFDTACSYFIKNIQREIMEETTLTLDDIEFPVLNAGLFIHPFNLKCFKFDDVSYYHAGIVFPYQLKPRSKFNIDSKEPNKHKVEIIPERLLEKDNPDNIVSKLDSWFTASVKQYVWDKQK